MKVLHVLYSGLGGHGNVFFSFVMGDRSNQFQYEALFNGIENVRDEYLQHCTRYNIPHDFVSKKPGMDLRYYRDLINKIRNSSAEVIFLHSSAYIFPAWIGSLLSKKRKMIVVRETQANHLKSRMEWLWLSAALVISDKIVFLSEAYRKEIKNKLSFFYRKRKVYVIPNGIDLELYNKSFLHPHESIVIGMQSRIVQIKDHKTLIKAFSLLLNDAELMGKVFLKIAGDGEYKNELINLTTSLKMIDSVKFTGMLPEADLINFLHSLDIYVHASLGETMSTAIMQAMACSLPVIASDVDGINNMILNETTGILVNARDVSAMYLAMKTLINDPVKRLFFGKQAYHYAVNNFSHVNMLNSYKNLFLGENKI